jgi:M3 family oligoendopeptidase
MSINEQKPIESLPFSSLDYQRPDIESISLTFSKLLGSMESAGNWTVFHENFRMFNTIRQDFSTAYNLCYIRHTSNTSDVFYDAENDFFDSNGPKLQEFTSKLYKILINTPYKSELVESYGPTLFRIAELSLKTFHPDIVPLLQEENRLTSEYVKVKSQAKIELDGEVYNLSSIFPLETDTKRETRKNASESKWAFFLENQKTIEDIFDQLVKVRDEMAKILGFQNFIELGYARMLRMDYDSSMVSTYRKSVQDYITPLVSKLYDRQKKRLGIDVLYFYDEEFKFPSGNPKPQGDPKWIVEQAEKMYEELSPETNAFFKEMKERNLLDLEARDDKAPGGYCTYIPNFKAPFIFANFNGTSGDIDVLTHEAGHAFQVFSSLNHPIPEYHWPTYEACEIHSMSMEFLTWPWMESFFLDETSKYKFAHLSGAISFLPYGVSVDEFQHEVYANPHWTPSQRNEAWRAIEKKYMPWRNYGENIFLNEGNYWMKQGHIFSSPFYYIDYTLAQVCAFQFWIKDQKNHKDAWSDYLTLCEAGGSMSFLTLVKLANLKSPFSPDTLMETIKPVEEWLETVDDSRY